MTNQVAMEITVQCPYSEDEIKTELDKIIKGQSVTCERCGRKFNVFSVYKSFYEDIPFAKKLADIHIKLVRGKYEVRGESADEVAKINSFLSSSNFDNLFLQIVSDTVIYGNCFIAADDERRSITRHDPAVSEIFTEWRQEPPRVSSFEVAGLVSKKGERIAPDYIIMFTHGSSHLPFGMSIYGFWFDSIYPLKIASKAELNASLLQGAGLHGHRTETLRKIREFFERQTAVGAGIPLTLAKGGNTPGFAMKQLALDTKFRRDDLITVIERELFPFILKRPWQTEEYPEFHIHGHTYRYHEY